MSRPNKTGHFPVALILNFIRASVPDTYDPELMLTQSALSLMPIERMDCMLSHCCVNLQMGLSLGHRRAARVGPSTATWLLCGATTPLACSPQLLNFRLPIQELAGCEARLILMLTCAPKAYCTAALLGRP
jgi:hypothetical protein